jgi:hypothetical protein
MCGETTLEETRNIGSNTGPKAAIKGKNYTLKRYLLSTPWRYNQLFQRFLREHGNLEIFDW